jgi:hypothetical protein
MRRVVQLIILGSILFILIAQPSFLGENPATSSLRSNVIEGPYGGVRLNKDDVSLLYINGSFYQMGLQLGSLIKDEFTINYRAFHAYYEEMGIPKTELINLWNKQQSFVPVEVKDYIQGCADALNLSFNDVACIWVAEGAAYSHHCSSYAAWGNATLTGELIHARSLEFPLTIQDPVTGSMIQDYPVIVIVDPDDYYAFTYPTYAGYVIEDGMNEEGIAISNMWSENHDQTSYGEPMGIRIFEALYKASSADEAIAILTSNRTYGYNFIVSDAEIPIGYAVETTASKYYAGTWDDPSEQIAPFWPIEQVVRRSNCYLDPSLALEQRTIYNPNNLIYWIRLILQGEPWAAVWSHYNALSLGLEDKWGQIQVMNSVDMIRTVYHGGYDPIWELLLSFRDEWTTWWQWVARPGSGEFVISFANGQTSAHWEPVLSFDLIKSIDNRLPTPI